MTATSVTIGFILGYYLGWPGVLVATLVGICLGLVIYLKRP